MGFGNGLHQSNIRTHVHKVPANRPNNLLSRGDLSGTSQRTEKVQTHTHRTFPPKPALEMYAMAVEFPVVEGHPNRLPFEGVLTLVDVASDKAPSGSRGHRVVLTRSAAEAALPSLLGMAVDYKTGWDGHDARQKCGIITSAELDGKRLAVAGYLFARDFPELEQKVQVEGVMGMSYELADAHVADMRASVWSLTRATFTGAAILLREKAAYHNTSFHLKRALPRLAAARSTGLRHPALPA